VKPFDSGSPRFNYKLEESRSKKAPGPGAYTKNFAEEEEMRLAEIRRTGTVNSKYIPAMGTENRQKFSLFGQITKQGEQDSHMGPGTYDTNIVNGFASKKGYNASL
jgi:hypothetical protein